MFFSQALTALGDFRCLEPNAWFGLWRRFGGNLGPEPAKRAGMPRCGRPKSFPPVWHSLRSRRRDWTRVSRTTSVAAKGLSRTARRIISHNIAQADLCAIWQDGFHDYVIRGDTVRRQLCCTTDGRLPALTEWLCAFEAAVSSSSGTKAGLLTRRAAQSRRRW